MESLGINYHAILPETITASVAVLIMMIDALARKIERRVAGAVSLVGLIAAAVAVASLWGRPLETCFKGMIITDDFRNFFAMIFLGLEITSISTYVLCGYRRRDLRSNESAMKYFILGSFSTAFLLYGIALVYGASYNPAANPVA